MLQPSRTKFRKAHKGRIKGVATSGATLSFGQFGLKAMEPDRLTARQIEAARRAMTRHMKRAGRVWIRIFPDVPVSKKPLEVRMGSGKGAPEFWVVRIKPGRILLRSTACRPRSPARRSISPPPSCRSRRASSSALRNRKRADVEDRGFAGDDARPARGRVAQAQEGAVQPALPARDRAAREHLAGARGASRHRPDQDGRAAEARGPASQLRSG